MLPLIVEGIENKIKKLIYRNQQFDQENTTLKQSLADLETKFNDLTAYSKTLEDQINKLKVAKTLTGKDNLQARQQINEMLREIQKCYSLLNR